MNEIRIGGLTGSNWRALSDSLSIRAKRRKRVQLTQHDGSLDALLRTTADDAQSGILILAYNRPEFSVASALRRGDKMLDALALWKDEATRVLSALEDASDRIILVSVSGIRFDPADFIEEVTMRTGFELEVRTPLPLAADALAHFDLAARFVSEAEGVLAIYESLEASAQVPSGGHGRPASADVLQAVKDMEAAKAADLQALEKVSTILARVAGGEIKAASGVRSIARIKAVSGGGLLETAKTGADEILRAHSRLETSAAQLEQKIGDRRDQETVLQEALDLTKSELLLLDHELREARQALSAPAPVAARAVPPAQAPAPAKQDAVGSDSVVQLVCNMLETAQAEVGEVERENDVLKAALSLQAEEAGEGLIQEAPVHEAVVDAAPRDVRPPAPSVSAEAKTGLSKWAWLARAYLALRRSAMFNADWYKARYPDVASSGRDPVMHYLLSGGLEGRSPSRHFCSQTYLNYYPDVRAARLNPLAHYLLSGREEGRFLFPVVDEKRDA